MQEPKYIRKSFILQQETKGFSSQGQVLAGVLSGNGQTASITVSGKVEEGAHIFLAKPQAGGTGWVDLGIPGTIFSMTDVGQTGYALKDFDLVLCGSVQADGTFPWWVSVGYLGRQRAWRGRVFALKEGAVQAKTEAAEAEVAEQKENAMLADTMQAQPTKQQPSVSTPGQKPTVEEVGSTFRQILERFCKEAPASSIGTVRWKDLLDKKPVKAASREETEPLQPMAGKAQGFASVSWPRQKQAALPLGKEWEKPAPVGNAQEANDDKGETARPREESQNAAKKPETAPLSEQTVLQQDQLSQEQPQPWQSSPWQVLLERQTGRPGARSAAEEGCWPDESAWEEKAQRQKEAAISQTMLEPEEPASSGPQEPSAEKQEGQSLSATPKPSAPQMQQDCTAGQVPTWEEIWRQMAETHSSFQPFAKKNAQWLRICKEELWLMPKRNAFVNSSMVALGDKKYSHLLLGRDEEGRFFLAVPGQYQRMNRNIALQEGFFDFWSKGEEEAKEGSYGYWMGRL